MDWLAAELAPLYEREMGRLARDPWQARDEYIEIILDRSPERVRAYLQRHCGGGGQSSRPPAWSGFGLRY